MIEPTPRSATTGIVTFRVEPHLLGIPITHVREINRQLDLTRVPRAPDFVRGLVNLRGQLVTVIDPGVRLGLGPRSVAPSSRLVVLKTRGELGVLSDASWSGIDDKVGLWIDAIGEVVTPRSGELEPPPSNLEASVSRLLRGVCQTEAAAIGLLDLNQLLESAPREVRSAA